MNDINGILVVNKPEGWTSHDVVKKTRNIFGGIKVGHTGTLDPMATGVLVLLIGIATKKANIFENDLKRYLAEVTFGRATNTYDRTGETTAVGDPKIVNINNLKTVLKSLAGESEQLPPMFSAIKIGGKKLYKLARAGKTIERKPRKIKIYSIKSDLTDYPRIMLDIECSKGTYIRSIAHQLGKMVDCPAHLSALQRTASGKYLIKDAVDFLSLIESAETGNMEQFVRPIKNYGKKYEGNKK